MNLISDKMNTSKCVSHTLPENAHVLRQLALKASQYTFYSIQDKGFAIIVNMCTIHQAIPNHLYLCMQWVFITSNQKISQLISAYKALTL